MNTRQKPELTKAGGAGVTCYRPRGRKKPLLINRGGGAGVTCYKPRKK